MIESEHNNALLVSSVVGIITNVIMMNGFLSRWLVCMFDDDLNYLLNKIGDHDDNVDPLFPDHTPERSTCVWHWTLEVVVMKTAMIEYIILCLTLGWAIAKTLCHFDNTCKDFNDTSNLIFLP